MQNRLELRGDAILFDNRPVGRLTIDEGTTLRQSVERAITGEGNDKSFASYDNIMQDVRKATVAGAVKMSDIEAVLRKYF